MADTNFIRPLLFTDLDDNTLANKALEVVREVLQQPTAEWTSEAQRRIILSTLRAQEDLLALLCTGSGKTMVALAAAKLEPQCATVVILPLRSLLKDYERKLDQMKISYQTWWAVGNDDKDLATHANLILVLIDQARKPAFKTALVKLNTSLPIRHLIVDEAHYGITANEYRRSCQHLYELRTLPVQFILLSGTVPPKSIPALRDMYMLQEYTSIIRTSTVRAETSYVILPPHTSSETQIRIREIADTYGAVFQDIDRGLLFTRSREDAELLAEKFKWPCYHGGIGSKDKGYGETERNAAFTKWRSGETRWMVCTSAFAAGNDYPAVRVCVYVDLGYEMMETVQAFGRAGRDHKHALAIIIPSPKPTRPSSADDIHKGLVDLWDMTYKKFSSPMENCIRYQITRWVDGVGTHCKAHPGIALCNRCMNYPHTMESTYWNTFPSVLPPLTQTTYTYTNPIITPPGDHPQTGVAKRPATSDEGFMEIARRSKCRQLIRQQKETAYIDTLKGYLERFKTSCSFCVTFEVTPMDHVQGHRDVLKCGTMDKKPLGTRTDDFKSWRANIKYHGHLQHHRNICWRCHVPQLREDLHGQNVRGQGAICRYADVIAPALWGCYFHSVLRAKAEAEFDTHWESVESFRQWCMAKGNGQHQTNAIELFIWWGEEMTARNV